MNYCFPLEEKNSTSNSFQLASKSILNKSSVSLKEIFLKKEFLKENKKKRKTSMHSLNESTNPLIDLINEEFINQKRNCRRKSCYCSKCGPITSFEKMTLGIALPTKKNWQEKLKKDEENLKNKKSKIISHFSSMFILITKKLIFCLKQRKL